METIKKLLSDILNIEFVQTVLSNPRKKEGILKVKVRPIEKKGNLFFQLESFTKTQAFHENLDPISARDRLLEYMEKLYIPDLINSGRSTGFWNLLRIFFQNLRKTERSRFWILDVENRI